ncbi:MAG TPA: acetate--CoA ligase family protein [Anaerolineales bacterium]
MDRSLLPFFQPSGIVVVGASSSEHKLGYGIARNLTQSGYAGAIHFVSQHAGQLFGRPVQTSVAVVPDPVDLAVLVIPAAAMRPSLAECANRGIRAAILISAGFREAGADGAALEAEVAAFAREHGMRILGPNCIGVIDTHFPFDTSFLQPPMPPRGGIAFASHSGAFCAAVVDWSRRQAFGFSQIISLGNQADITETDVLPALAENNDTRVIALYMESVSDGRKFVRAAREVTARKPVVAIKVGRTESGRKAAASHTAAMAGSDSAFDAAFEKCGILRASTTEQLFDWAHALECCPLPAGRAVSVLTNAGGPGVIAADALESLGLELARPGSATRAKLKERLPAAASIENPIDMLASASPDDYAVCLDVLLQEPATHAAIVILPPPPMYTAEAVAKALIPVIQASDKPVVVALLGSELTEAAFQAFASDRIPTYPFPERAASALAALSRYSIWRRPASDVLVRPFRIGETKHEDPAALISAYGIPSPASKLATSADDAAALASEIGFPVVMKIASPDIVHKSDVGGVLMGIRDVASVRSGYTQVVDSSRRESPAARIEGVHIQAQILDGQEVILGVVRDPQFGPLVMFGAGGVEAEAIRDVAFALAPLDELEAEALMERTWAGRRLRGFRNIPPADRAAAIDALVRLSWLAFEHPELDQIEINPLRVLAHGALALDVRFTPITSPGISG